MLLHLFSLQFKKAAVKVSNICLQSMLTSLIFQADFGSLAFSSGLVIPVPHVVGQLSQLAHGVRSGDVTFIDVKRFTIETLHYDGLGPGSAMCTCMYTCGYKLHIMKFCVFMTLI